MTWLGELNLDYRLQRLGEAPAAASRTVVLDRHSGPLRVLRSLYPEGDAVCHTVLVHPPGGIVGGDELRVNARLQAGSHAFITTPGATRYYRSSGALAAQRVRLELQAGARAEWLPLENIAHPGCRALNHIDLQLAEGAEMMGWDLLALGLPASGEAFDDPAHAQGCFEQQLHWPGVWLERACIRANDPLLLNSPLGLAGRRVMATLWFAAGSGLTAPRRQALLDSARGDIETSPLAASSGCTSPEPRLLLLRVLAERVEPAMQLLQQAWASWRQEAWTLAPPPQRLWRT